MKRTMSLFPFPPRRPAMFAVLLAAAFTAQAETAAPAAWRGHLEVLRQEGPGCKAEPAVPFRVPVEAVRDGDGLLVWGEMQTVRLRPAAGSGTHAIEVLEKGAGATGEVTLAFNATRAGGEWRERADAGSGCAYVLGRLALTSIDAAESTQAQAALGRYLLDLHAARRDLLDAHARAQAQPAAARLQALADRLPPAGIADTDIAQTFLDAAEHLAALRDRRAALRLAEASTTAYRRVADRLPESAALAIAAYGRMARRAGDPAAGTRLVDEALDLLARAGRTDSAAGASVLTQQGNWRRAQGDLGGAIESFGRALLADERRGAPADLRAMALTNLGVTLADAGHLDRARQCLEGALAIAPESEGERTLREVIRDHLAALDKRGQGTGGSA